MFDPSKINLDENSKEDLKVKKEIKTSQNNEKVDILGSLDQKNKSDKPSFQEEQKDSTFLLDNKKEDEDDGLVEEKKEKKKIIFDVNIKSLKDILNILIDKEKKYDFVTFEPDNKKITISFRKNGKIVENKYIKYNIYSSILIKIKSLTKLEIEETEKTQEGKGKLTIESENYNVVTKIVPSGFGENLFIKLTKTGKTKKQLKEKKRSSISQMLAFFGSLVFISLIIGGGFLSFIVINAKTVDDVRFFESLNINLNQINAFIGRFIFIIFLLLTFILVILLVIFLFKFLLTKKIYKNKKVRYGIVSLFLFLLIFGTVSSWMYITKKVENLPSWGEIVKGEVQLFDNGKLKSEYFDETSAFISQDEVNEGLIGPIEIKFDTSVLKEQEEDNGNTIQEYHWIFDGEESIETDTQIIKEFNEKGKTDVELSIIEKNSMGEIVEKPITSIISIINISDIVKIKEIPQETGGKLISFDSENLESMGEAEWYTMDNLEEPVAIGYKYTTAEPIFEETLIGLYLRKKDKESEVLDKIFIIKGEEKSKLNAEIEFDVDPIDDLEYTFRISNPEIDSGAGIIESFIWSIGGKQYTRKGVYGKLEESSEIEHLFEEYGEQEIELKMIDSNGNEKTIKKEITVEKVLSLTEGLKIYSNEIEIENVIYNPILGTYYIKDLGAPSTLTFDARDATFGKVLYYLDNVTWDFNGDGDIDATGKQTTLDLIQKSGTKTINVVYTFKNRKLENDIKEIEEKITLDIVEKEAMINFHIKKDSEYVPIDVGFDASMSQVTGENITKFKWDFGDGESTEGGAVIEGHRYSEAGDYVVKLVVVTESGKTYSTQQNLILTSIPDKLKIGVSLKEAPVGQEIDFDTADSYGDIISYFWDFGDGETSVKSNPSHYYKKEGTYEVKLEASFRNKNIMTDTISIKVY